jgi:hypothetical protein
VQRDPGPDPDLVADHHRLAEGPRRSIDRLGDRECRRDHHRSGVSLGEPVAVVEIEHVGQHAVGECGADRTDVAAVTEQRRFVARVDDGRVLGSDPRRRRRPAGHAHRGHIGEQQIKSLAGRRR